MQRPDICAVMKGQARPTEDTDQAEGTAPLLTPGITYTAGGKRQAAFDRVNQDLYVILYLVTDKAEALLVAIHTSVGPVATGRKP